MSKLLNLIADLDPAFPMAAVDSSSALATADAEGIGFPTPTYPGPPPQWAIVREINFQIIPKPDGKDELQFFYSRYTNDVSVPTVAAFNQLLTDVRNPNYQFSGGPSEPVDPFANPLSLNCHRLSYVIFKLSKKAWQFARKGPPIKLGYPGYNAAHYFDAHRVGPNGNRDRGDNPAILIDGCKVAYLIADGASASAGGNYDHAFNLYVDLLLSGGGVGHMPIILDPDVRHPGGSDEP